MLSRALASFPGKSACFTELGYLTPEGYGALPPGFEWAGNVTVAQQAQWLGLAARRSAASVVLRRVGHSRMKPSPGHLRVASMPILLP